MKEQELKQLAQQASDACVRKNRSLDNTMSPDEQYWYMQGWIDSHLDKD